MRSPSRLPRVRLQAQARSWRWAWLGSLALVAACGAVLAPLHGSTPNLDGAAHAAASMRLQPAAVTASIDEEDRLRGLVATADGPEGRLIAAYVALGAGDGRKAFELTQELVREHPEFALAQLLYGDLLATRAGVPSSFGPDGQDAAPTTGDERRKALHDEALRRLAALRERPPAGKVPAEFAQLPASIRHAVAVDASRSRLYLFTNGPQGLSFERDVYVSIGKQGMAKQVEGDKRTPLGVYWITAAVPDTQLDERFGKAALRINYPNAFDRLSGRSGFGLYLHGVPSNVMNHVPWATDGCVAMSNDDVTHLHKTLALDSTPVVIARELNWVAPQDAQRSAAEFRPAYMAWDQARRGADTKALKAWYDTNVPVPSETAQDKRERDEVSFVAWSGDAAPMMIVTAQRKAAPGEETYRQYWIQRGGEWRILFDGPVSVSERGATQIALAPDVAEPKPVRQRGQAAVAKKSKKDKKRRAEERRTAERRQAGEPRS